MRPIFKMPARRAAPQSNPVAAPAQTPFTNPALKPAQSVLPANFAGSMGKMSGPLGGAGTRVPVFGAPKKGLPLSPAETDTFPTNQSKPSAPFGQSLGALFNLKPQQGQAAKPMKSGGMTASKRADGCAQRGKTKGKMV